MYNILIVVLLFMNLLFLLVGYILGKLTKNDGVYNTRPKSFFDNNKDPISTKIAIDDTKVVTDIKTDNLEKKYDQLGTTVQSTENISSAINKLKNMKG